VHGPQRRQIGRIGRVLRRVVELMRVGGEVEQLFEAAFIFDVFLGGRAHAGISVRFALEAVHRALDQERASPWRGGGGKERAERLPILRGAILGGEAIVQNGNGASDFEALSSALQRRPHSIILYAFDLLHLDGNDLRQQTLMERRASLKHLVGADDQSRIQFSDEFDGDGDALFKACAEQGLEGVVSKHALAPLSYAGAAFIALSGEDRTRFFAELERLATSWAVFKSSRLMDVKWCHPKLVVEVKHLAGGKLLRHATVKRLAT
jgi:ATP dependent DNA ligase domain